MLVATTSFTDPSDGQPIHANRTWVSEFSEIALAYPSRFRSATPVVGRDRDRVTAVVDAPCRVADEPPRGELPRFYPDLPPTREAFLGRGARHAIENEVRSARAELGPEFETGGWLFGDAAWSDFASVATGPGENSRHSHSSVQLNPELLAEVVRNYGHLHPFGDWHLHATGDPIPSTTDRRAWACGARNVSGHTWLGLIVTPARSMFGEPELHAWGTFPLVDRKTLVCERLYLEEH